MPERTVFMALDELDLHDVWLDAVNVVEPPGRGWGLLVLEIGAVPAYDGKFGARLHFEECMSMRLNLNFGVTPRDSIRQATTTEHSMETAELLNRWRAIGSDVHGFRTHIIETNSTASTMTVVCRRVLLERVAGSGKHM